MTKRRGPDDRRNIEPEDVLAGRIKLGVSELLDLIHRVNPTGRDLPAREAELRYVQKSRLQSVLVRRFGPEIEVVADLEREGTVSLHHRGHGRDGCHAIVDALDEDARAWVQLQLDLGPPSSEAPPARAARPSGRGQPPLTEEDGIPPSAEATPESLVRRADEDLGAYDYERARAHLERAVTASGGAAGPAAALLPLLVETLGDDAGALSLQASKLSRGALADPDVRAGSAPHACGGRDRARGRAACRAGRARGAEGEAGGPGARRGAGGAARSRRRRRGRGPRAPRCAGPARSRRGGAGGGGGAARGGGADRGPGAARGRRRAAPAARAALRGAGARRGAPGRGGGRRRRALGGRAAGHLVRAEVVLRTPEPMGTAVHHVLGHTAWITGKRGPLLGFDVLRARPAPERPEPDGAPAPLLLTQLVWALHDADARLDAGDPDGALAALSPARFDAGAEVQFLARRAEAWLRLSPPPGPRRFAKIVALARLLEAHEGWPDGARYELPIPGATWDRARLDELTRRAGAWLEAQGGERSERSGPDRPLDTTEPAPDAT